MARPSDYILIRYDLPGAPLFHERLVTAVSVANPGTVATFTADGDHFAEDAQSDDAAGVRWSGAQGSTPPGVDAQQIYRFRQIPTAAELDQLKRGGALMVGGVAPGPPAAAAGAIVAAGGDAGAAPPPRQAGEAGVVARVGAHVARPAVAATVWLATEDYRGLRRGERLPDPLPHGAIIQDDAALVPVQSGWITARQVPAGDVDAFVVDDSRVLSVRFNQEGSRRRPYPEAVDLQVADEPEGGLMLEGPPSCRWLLQSWRDAGLAPSAHRANWL